MSSTVAQPAGPYGLLAEFDTPQALQEACYRVTAAGFTKTDAFSPFPIHGLSHAMFEQGDMEAGSKFIASSMLG